MRLKDETRAIAFAMLMSLLMVFSIASCTSRPDNQSSGGESFAPAAATQAVGGRHPAGLLGANSEYGKDTTQAYYDAPEAKGLKTRAEYFGRDIWIKATGGNERFHMYSIAQKIGDHNMNFWRMLQSKKRYTRFNDWGLMNDPDCCTPGDAGCPKKSLAETYGMDYCPGDDELYTFVGRKDAEYRDPACDLDKHLEGQPQGYQSACDLKYGTSAGAVGFRKFPNPRFDRDKWMKIAGNGMDSWEGYNRQIADGSIEPPFRIGISCASCHESFDPVHPPSDPNRPTWMNLNATVGNQYMYSAQIFGSGFPKDAIEWQMLANSRPGTVDTSAVPNDQVHNPGTINAIMNLTKRPTFQETVNTWRRVQSCTAGADQDVCTCSATGARCYEKGKKVDTVLHILKGGEDSIGKEGGVLRVYINIGTCAEQCWLNHLTDLRTLDKSGRNYGQTPFDIGQCRRDCPNYRALEDRVEIERDFLLAANTFDLYKAKNFSTPDELVPYIEGERGFGEGSVGRGRQVYAQSCARCHSSQKDSLESRDFLAKDNKGRRIDWLGSDERINADEVGTYECRAQHSNHMKGHIWEQYASEEQRAQAPVHNLSGPASEGRGHYRAISLLNVWAFAPFMHNNAVGPEICGKSQGGFFMNIANVSTCTPFDPSTDGRLGLYEKSMDALLHPETRGKKVTLTSSEIRIPIGLSVMDKDHNQQGFAIVIPKGVTVARVGAFRHKDFVSDLAAGISNTLTLGNSKASPEQKEVATQVVRQLVSDIIGMKGHDIVLNEEMLKKLGSAYSNCTDTIDDKGHTFGSELDERAKKDLTAFMETL